MRDHGVGISPSERKRIFKRFYRIPGAMRTRVKGTGLGLFIVRSVVARHGGKVFAESDGPGHGSTFTVQLPVVRGAAMSRILVVEDEQHLADGLRFNLEAEQHDVDVVDNGEERARAADRRAGRYDLVILDVMLPGIDGFAVVDRAARRAGRFVPVLMLTARGRSEDVLRGFGARRRRLPAEAVRAADPAVARARPAAAPRVVPARRPRRSRRRSRRSSRSATRASTSSSSKCASATSGCR